MTRIDLTALHTLTDLQALLRRMRAASVFVDPPDAMTPLLDALEAVLAACDDPNTGPPGDPWTYGYEAALDDIRETITTALGADHD